MNNKTHKKILVGGVIATLAFLPGCADMFKGGSAQNQTESSSSANKAPMTGETLVTMKGAPAITTDSLELEKEKFLKANPQIRQALAFMDPKAFDRNLLEGLIQQAIADEYVAANGISESAAYKAELQDLCKSMERLLNAKSFTEQITVSVPDAEVKAFYDTNKDKLRGVMISQGGVAATGIEFADGAAARAFVARVKTAPGGFKKVAQDDGLTAKIRDFKLVNNQSIGIDEVLRDKVAAIKTVPSVELVDANGMFWVINATAKEEPKFIPYEQIKDKLKQELEQNKRAEISEKKVNELRSQYGVEVNEDYFKLEDATEQGAMPAGAMASAAAPQEAQEKRLA